MSYIKEYKVHHYQDGIYEIVLREQEKQIKVDVGDSYEMLGNNGSPHFSTLFKGTLVECNAWLSLNDKGYL